MEHKIEGVFGRLALKMPAGSTHAKVQARRVNLKATAGLARRRRTQREALSAQPAGLEVSITSAMHVSPCYG